MFICPFWQQKDHVGMFRAERLVRWLRKLGFEVVVVAAGHDNSSHETDFGKLIVVRDPLRIYPDVFSLNTSFGTPIPSRKPNKFRRWMAYFLLVPDLHIRWTKAVLKSEQVSEVARVCDFFMASSPPESSFIAAASLGSRLDKKFIMDMRDGWLDEPMKPLLKTLWIQRFREKRIEKRLLKKAGAICVTSENWEKLLLSRYPKLTNKIHIIPNCYPEYVNTEKVNSEELNSDTTSSLQLIHAGRISGSRPERNIEPLLNRLLQYIVNKKIKFTVKFLGVLDSSEIKLIDTWNKRFVEHDSNLIFLNSVTRTEALNLMTSANGLIMVSNSYASIPAKYYDYSVTGRPVLNLTINDSASVKVSSVQPHFYNLIETTNTDISTGDSQYKIVDSFINHCKSVVPVDAVLNPDFTEKEVLKRFKIIINTLKNGG
jgi:hypothetical protein